MYHYFVEVLADWSCPGLLNSPNTFICSDFHSFSLIEQKQMAIYRYTAYKTPNIGIFAKANDSIVLVPFGFAETKSQKLAEYLQAKEVYTSVAGTRLLGPMTVMNNNGILLPSIASDEEVQLLKQASGLNVERVESRFT